MAPADDPNLLIINSQMVDRATFEQYQRLQMEYREVSSRLGASLHSLRLTCEKLQQDLNKDGPLHLVYQGRILI